MLAAEGREEHPVDVSVRRQVARPDLERTLARASTAIIDALGRRSSLWFKYERAKDELTALREATYFDVGVAYGSASAAAKPDARCRPNVRALAERIVQDILSAGVERCDAVSAALAAASTLLEQSEAKRVERSRR